MFYFSAVEFVTSKIQVRLIVLTSRHVGFRARDAYIIDVIGLTELER